MAPMPENIIDAHLKSIIQLLYDIQSLTHGYLSPQQTTPVLTSKLHALTTSLAALSHAAAGLTGTAADLIPPEIIAYVDEGRNPDIYTREFVELVQRGNVFLKGKGEAWGGFADVLGEEMDNAGLGGGRGNESLMVVKREGDGGLEVSAEKVKEEDGEKKDGV